MVLLNATSTTLKLAQLSLQLAVASFNQPEMPSCVGGVKPASCCIQVKFGLLLASNVLMLPLFPLATFKLVNWLEAHVKISKEVH
jgi:hypothetical protein